MFTFRGRDYDSQTHALSPAGRVVKLTGNQAKRYLRDHHVAPVNGVPTMLPGRREENPDAVLNPLTGRLVAVGSRRYNALMNAGFVRTPAGAIVQPDRFDRIPLRGLDRRGIEQALRDLVARNPGRGLLLLDPRAARAPAALRKSDLAGLLGAYSEYTDNYLADFGQLIARINEGEEDGLANLIVVVPQDGHARDQLLLADEGQGFCVRECLRAVLPEEDWSAVEDCLDLPALAQLAVARNLSFRIYGLEDFAEPRWTIGTGRPVRLYVAANHAVPLADGARWAGIDAPVAFHETVGELLAAYRETVRTEPVRLMAPGGSVLGFTTLRQHHKLRFVGSEIHPERWSTTGAALEEFRRHNGQCDPTPFKDLDKKLVVQPGITYSTRVDSGTPLWCYDQRRAYKSYAKCPYYRGFPRPSGPYRRYAWSDQILELPVEGLALARSDSPYPASCLESTCTVGFSPQWMWVPLCQVRYALDRGERLQLRECVVAKRIDHDPYHETNEIFSQYFQARAEAGGDRAEIQRQEKLWYNALVGRQYMSTSYPTKIATSCEEFAALAEQGFMHRRQVDVGQGQYVWICCRNEPDQEVLPEFAFTAAYVLAYQKISLHHDLVGRLHEAGLAWADVKRIWVDGVYLTRPLPEGFLPEDRWKPAEQIQASDELFYRAHHASRICVPPEAPAPGFPGLMQLEPRLAILGPPGSGKTTRCRERFEGEDLCLTASTHIAAAQLGQARTAQGLATILAKNPRQARAEVRGRRIVIDEFTMLSCEEIEALLGLGAPVCLMGDFEQLTLPPEAGRTVPSREWLAAQGFVIEELDTIHRAADPETLDLYRSCRGKTVAQILAACAGAGVPTADPYGPVVYPGPFERAHYVTSKNHEVQRHNVLYAKSFEGRPGYKLATWGTTASKKTAYEAGLCPGMLAIAILGRATLANQESCVVLELLGDDRGSEKVKVRSLLTGHEHTVSLRCLHPGYAVTFHRLQGSTLDCPLRVSLDCLFEGPKMLYVAVTRVTSKRFLTLVRERTAAERRADDVIEARGEALGTRAELVRRFERP